MKSIWIRLAADYGGVLNSGLCLLHCAISPLLLAFWGVHQHTMEQWESAFLLVSGLLVVGATWRMSTKSLRVAIWGFFTLFVSAEFWQHSYPWLELVQYMASAGLIATHLLNMRYCHRACA
ncbi:MerC domain-containing protein [Hymenobacter sp. GOD-10R]|uniref:MerC domain-containing protein n=1 Tax=Hymenobacter sp. GOD-10R TaxID=3093922 RepID=UPI002D77E339|nr:MerC domain-containing protein [Hymenobacter sp. GOD-10R]WRQ31250.1 MerC domain-containing protein [Hymenobacter sp. GOD-10R]